MGRPLLVVKVGGRLIASSALASIVDDVAGLAGRYDIVLVHGGGDIVTEYSRRFGVEPRFVVSPSGVRSRYTSREELEVYTMVMAGKINKELVAALAAKGLKALGVAGADCGLLLAERKKRIVIVNERGRRQVIPGGYTGRIVGVNAACAKALLAAVDILVVAPLALGIEGELLNVDGDQAAAEIAAALKAEYLVLLTDVDGVILGGKTLGRVRLEELGDVAARVGFGMNRKLLMAGRAVERGVGAAIISSGLKGEPVTRALGGAGTWVVPG